MLENVTNFIQKIKSIAEKINLSLFENFFGSSSPANYAKKLINAKNPDKNKEFVDKLNDRISGLKDRIKKVSKREKKSADEALKIIEEILDYNKNAQKFFSVASKVDKEKSEPKPEESISERVKLRRQRSAEIAKKEGR